MDTKKLREMSAKFSLYVSLELRGAISSTCISQAEVCRRIGRQSGNVSRWLRGSPAMPIDVAYEICNAIDVPISVIVDRAMQRMIMDSPESISDTEFASAIVDFSKLNLVANEDKHKEDEAANGEWR
ncbi:helix-turn-helix domain-containing protein [Gardnerella sp. DNF01198P]|uniref:helix-turn-helix domain-containing protein n=1 Tax=Gardnerella sp. DNF01198P TaxID=2749066 RepID=UPI003BAA61AF